MQEALREAYARWATGVTVVAVREGSQVHALTVSAFMPVSVEPPLVLVSLGPNAAALPYLDTGTPFAVSLLTSGQRGLASRYADPLPVGPSPFPDAGPPVVEGALASLVCTVEDVRPAGDHHLVTGRVVEARTATDGGALAYFRREYREIGDPR